MLVCRLSIKKKIIMNNRYFYLKIREALLSVIFQKLNFLNLYSKISSYLRFFNQCDRLSKRALSTIPKRLQIFFDSFKFMKNFPKRRGDLFCFFIKRAGNSEPKNIWLKIKILIFQSIKSDLNAVNSNWISGPQTDSSQFHFCNLSRWRIRHGIP